MTVFMSGRLHGSSSSTPVGGQVFQAAAVSIQLPTSGMIARDSLKIAMSKNIQKKETKNITSEAMNNTMP